MLVLAAVGEAGYAGDNAITQADGARGDGVERQILPIAGSVASPGGEEEVCDEKEEEEGDYGGNGERLHRERGK